ncbi:hypothetical protein B0T16DRAFT_320345 [Cercophora newfieldiana]|uniref:DH domain-containing protein n=1 Tax=Cercophora newfieldiana TaxID=92897 RepID=A0AA40CZC1_9PEZI|nr:hypothetical protein B0T16DRAFT_320345 [Cercophora newfieldiana]
MDDDGNYGDEAASRTGPFVDHRQQQHQHQHLQPHQHHHQQHSDYDRDHNHDQLRYRHHPPQPQQPAYQAQPTSPDSAGSSSSSSPFPPLTPGFDSRPSQIPVASYAAANAQAFAANARIDESLEPDDFYRSYRGVQPGDAIAPSIDSMATAPAVQSSASRQPTSLRSNGNGTTPKHPAVPTGRTPLRAGFRSVSNPVDDRQASVARQQSAPGNGYSPVAGAFPPSVKDLKKKFDQTGSPSNSSVRKNTLRPTRETPSTGSNGRSTGLGGGPASYGSLRAPSNRDVGHEPTRASTVRGTQRPKFVPEDQASANQQSFASRISRPRNAVSPNTQESKSSTQLSPGISSDLPTSPPRSSGLLFGEILPEYSDSATAGFGIEEHPPRRTSESSVQNVARPHARSLSDPDHDPEPPSPTDWYRAAAADQQAPEQHAPNPTAGHSRVNSDLAASKLNTSRLGHRTQGTVRPTHDDSSPTSPTSPTSRLPILMRKMTSTSGRTSPTSTRSNSPATSKQTSAGVRPSKQHGAGRAKTPTCRAATPARAKTPTPSHTPGSTRKPPPSNIATPANGRLNAYVSAPTPKLSPSLRSSRPRQSVATATTAASRMRAGPRPPSPTRSAQRSTSKVDEATTRRRKISVGPIDFAQRRETIKLAYSKSIRDSQAREARQAAAERRKKELEVVARVKLEAEAATTGIAAAAAAAAAAAISVVPSPSSETGRPPELATPIERTIEVPLKIETNLPPPQPRPTPKTSSHLDSPTLGIPGSFPTAGSPRLDEYDDVPLSAVSVASATTMFDIDEQTEPARPETLDGTATIDHDLGIVMPSHSQTSVSIALPHQPAPPTLHKRASYQYPFDDDEDIEDDDDVSTKLSLGACSQDSPQITPTRTEFELAPADPEPCEEEYEPQPYTYTSQNYETTVTILGPGSDFKPSYKDQLGNTTPPAELLHEDKPPVNEAPEIITSEILRSGSMQPDNVRVELNDLDRLEDFYTGPRLRDNIAALRDSTPASSDVDVPYDPPLSSADYQKAPDTSHNLAVPALLSPANRLSQGSTWTDFSFGSDDRDAGPASSAAHSHDLDIPLERKSTFKLTPSSDDLSCHGSSVGDINHSPEPSPLAKPSVSPSMLADSPRGKHRLPDLNAGDDFAIPFSSQPRRVPLLPNHDPPPPPIPQSEYRLDNAVYEPQSRPESYVYGQEEESASSTQPSITSLNRNSTRKLTLDSSKPPSISSITHKAQPSESQSLLSDEQKRLRQRQLVIRELIDTEDVFVRDMSIVEEIYKGTAEACPGLDSKTIKLVFRNSDDIIGFHATFLAQLKEAALSVYTPKGRRSPVQVPESVRDADSVTLVSTTSGGTQKSDLDDEKDRQTALGPVFSKNIERLRTVHEAYLKSSDLSTKRLLQIQEDDTVNLWLKECNEAAKDLTTAWNLDSLLIKPMQRITKYPDILTHLLKYTPTDHPDREALVAAKNDVMTAIEDINKTKKNFELVGQIVGRKRKESDVRAGLARAFGKRVDKLQAPTKTADDDEFARLHERFQDDYLRLQVVLRDVEFYTRNVATYVHEFLQYLSSMELVMRLQPSRDYAHLESKWVQFNVSMRDIEKIALEKHLSDVRKHVIEPFEQVIRCYGNPTLALKKRSKRRLDFDKYLSLKANGKKVDKQLTELVEQYEALNDTLKKELPKLSALTAKVGNICLGKFVSIQATWYLVWKEKVKAPLQDLGHVPELSEIVTTFQREFQLQEERASAIGILNPTLKGRTSQSTTDDTSSTLSKTRSRPADLLPSRGRGLSINSDHVPSLPTPDFAKRNSGQFSLSPSSPGHYYRDYYSGINGHSRGISGSPITPDPASATRPTMGLARPNTGRSFESTSISIPRQSSESAANAASQNWRDSNSTYNSNYPGTEARRLSGLFHSALPLPDGPEESMRSSRASSSERPNNGGYNVLWLAASLFEFNIETTKHEAGYPYLTYQAGEIFDVIAEKGELWLAKNQDDPQNSVGWIWSKHFAKLADS